MLVYTSESVLNLCRVSIVTLHIDLFLLYQHTVGRDHAWIQRSSGVCMCQCAESEAAVCTGIHRGNSRLTCPETCHEVANTLFPTNPAYVFIYCAVSVHSNIYKPV